MDTVSKHYKELVQRRADLIAEGEALLETGELTDEARARDDAINAEIKQLDSDIARHETRRAQKRAAPSALAAIRLTKPEGSQMAAFQFWARTGDKGPLIDGGWAETNEIEGIGEGVRIMAASNATDMNIGTAADGGDTVPTGFYNRIIARRDESDLASRLPLLDVPTDAGGNAFDIPADDEADGEFVATNEAQDFDLDAPALTKKTATLVLYSKYTDVSYQLLRSTPTKLEEFLSNWVGRGWAKTRNNLLLTEVAANGTAFDTFASATAIAFGEPENFVGNNDLAPYLDEDNAIAWVMRASTLWAIKSIVGDQRQYAGMESGGKQLLGYPVYYSQKAAAPAANAKSMYFGNWRYVAKAERDGLTFLRDPYTVAIKGQVRLLWHFEIDFVVTQAEAIGYGLHPSA